MKHYLYSLLLLLYINVASAQTSLRGIYVDHFGSEIFGNQAKEDSLLNYAQDSAFNYLAMYDLHMIDMLDPSTADALGAFIKRARENYGIQYVGAVGEHFGSFKNKIGPFNQNRSDDNEKFNVFNLEFEFWTTSSVNPGGYYCVQYLQPNNCSCDTSGGFKFFIDQIHKIDSLANLQQVISETYVGWFNQWQAQQMQQNVDRILLHAYRTNTSSLFSYSKTRLQYLASNNQMVDVAPIFSAEPEFMGAWLESHSQAEAFNTYQADFDNDNSSWKQYINILGYQWFDWMYLPKPAPPTFQPTITASGSLNICAGNGVTLTASGGNSYAWSNGATTQSIVVTNTGDYSCQVTLNNETATTEVKTVNVKNKPIVTITPGINSNGQQPLTANATAGSGNISSYQWKFNNTLINGANSAGFITVADGSYTVEVTNSYNCSTESVAENIVFSGNCISSIPSGLDSDPVTEVSIMLNWAAGQTGDSIIIRYHPDDGSEVYQYVRMKNVGQTEFLLNNLQPQTTYAWEMFTVCGGTEGNISIRQYFTTGALTGLHELTSDVKIRVYPNPVSEKLFLDFLSNMAGEGEITLYDLQSKLIFSRKLQIGYGQNRHSINVSNYPNGVYLLSLKSGENVSTERIVIGK